MGRHGTLLYTDPHHRRLLPVLRASPLRGGLTGSIQVRGGRGAGQDEGERGCGLHVASRQGGVGGLRGGGRRVGGDRLRGQGLHRVGVARQLHVHRARTRGVQVNWRHLLGAQLQRHGDGRRHHGRVVGAGARAVQRGAHRRGTQTAPLQVAPDRTHATTITVRQEG